VTDIGSVLSPTLDAQRKRKHEREEVLQAEVDSLHYQLAQQNEKIERLEESAAKRRK
jgi:hypothetical protein